MGKTGPKPRDPRHYFEENYIPEPNSGCFLWLGPTYSNGYAWIGIRGHAVTAHRFALQISTGQSGEGLFACHRCDVPLCVNPDHLFWGTPADNMADKVSKGRGWNGIRPLGEANHKAKITEDDVRMIRASTATLVVDAARYGVGFTTIAKIKTRKTWRHVL